jgi:two-component system response regulator
MNSESVEILLVEDNPEDAELAIRVLTRKKLASRMHWVKDGEEALDFVFARGSYAERAGQAEPKVILLDLKLPKVNGMEVLRQLRADERTRTIPVAVLTSSKENEDILGAYKLSVNAYIVKPIDFDQYSEAVAQMGFHWLVLNQTPR